VSIELIPIRSLPEFRPGDDVTALAETALRRERLRDGDILAVTSKIVSKAEDRIVTDADGKAAWVERESVRVVARRGDLVIAETRHGFVCANAGVDASNVDEGTLALLPQDPDSSAARIREEVSRRIGVDVGVVITDTFGRPWRAGVLDVAIGCAGLPALLDLRGSRDMRGRVLEATVVALADQVAAAAGLVMGKADGVPVALVRGLTHEGYGSAADLVRSPREDMFRESAIRSIHSRRTIRTFGEGPVDREDIVEAISAACTAPAPHHTRPWGFATVRAGLGRRRMLDAMAVAWRRDLEADGVKEATIERRLERSERLLGEAPLVVVPMVRTDGAHEYPDARRSQAEREMFLLSGGAAIQNFLLALHDIGLASCWISSTLFCREETLQALGLDAGWIPLGAVAIGNPPGEEPRPRSPVDVGELLFEF
jgi:coenzyme F420-0:L-glutamate ligase/coenzyme F420-1:gamma-L-glutamate ligase